MTRTQSDAVEVQSRRIQPNESPMHPPHTCIGVTQSIASLAAGPIETTSQKEMMQRAKTTKVSGHAIENCLPTPLIPSLDRLLPVQQGVSRRHEAAPHGQLSR